MYHIYNGRHKCVIYTILMLFLRLTDNHQSVIRECCFKYLNPIMIYSQNSELLLELFVIQMIRDN